MMQVVLGEGINPLDYDEGDLVVCSSIRPFIEAVVQYARSNVHCTIIVNSKESREVYRAIAKAYELKVIEVSL